MRSVARTGYIDRARKEAIVAETRSCVMAAQTIAAEKYGANAVDVADDDMMDAVDDIKELAQYVTQKDYDEGAVKEVIEKFVLGENHE